MCGNFRDVPVGCQCIHPLHSVSCISIYARLRGAYHVECDDIFEGDFASFIFLDEDFVYADGTGASWESEDKLVFGGWLEAFDSVWIVLV